MTTHHITNKTPGMLDMSPLKDVLGRGLTLRGNEERDVDDETLGNPIMQRMVHAKWVTVGAPAAPPLPTTPRTPAAAAPPPPATPSTPAAAAPPLPSTTDTQVMPSAKMAALVKETKRPEPNEDDHE